MTDFTAHEITQSGNIFMRALTAFWNGLIQIGETSARARMLHELSEISDAELERMGTTRVDIVRRAFSDGYTL